MLWKWLVLPTEELKAWQIASVSKKKWCIWKLKGLPIISHQEVLCIYDLHKSFKIVAFTLCQLNPSLELVFSSAFGYVLFSILCSQLKRNFCSNITVSRNPGVPRFGRTRFFWKGWKMPASLYFLVSLRCVSHSGMSVLPLNCPKAYLTCLLAVTWSGAALFSFCGWLEEYWFPFHCTRWLLCLFPEAQLKMKHEKYLTSCIQSYHQLSFLSFIIK